MNPPKTSPTHKTDIILSLFLIVASLTNAAGLCRAQQAGGQAPSAQQPVSADVETEVEAFILHYIKTLETRDEKAIRDLFASDKGVAWFTDGVKSYSTADEILAGMKRYAGVTFKTTISDVCVVPLTLAVASARSNFHTKLAGPGTDDYEFGGVITWIVEKTESGKWTVLQGHTSTPAGPPTSGKQEARPAEEETGTTPIAKPLDKPAAQVENEVKAFLEHYIATLEGGAERGVRELFVADDRFGWFTDGVQSYATADDVLAGMRRFAGITFKTTMSDVGVKPITATLAIAESKFHTRLTLPGSETHEYGGVITWVLERAGTDGPWKVLEGHTSTPGGPPGKGRADEKR